MQAKRTTPIPKIRVLICDDHPMMIIGIRDFLLLQPNIEIIGTVTTGHEAIRVSKEADPDILLLDIALPDISGIEATRFILKEKPHIRIILLTMHDDDEYAKQFVKSGAKGYVLKKSSPDELIQAIDAVMNDRSFVSPSIASMILTEHRKNLWVNNYELTDREEAVIRLIAKGLTSKEIAQRLCVSTRTVGKHREALMIKLNLHSVAEITQYAITKKLIQI